MSRGERLPCAPVDPAEFAENAETLLWGKCQEITPWQRMVLQLAADGEGNKQIACILRLRVSTVKNHFKDIFWQLGVSNRTAAVVYAWKKGWIR